MSAPAPKPSTSPMTRSGQGRPSASTAPRTSDEAATAPQSKAEDMRDGSVRCLPVETEADFLTAARADPALAVLEGVHALKHALRFGADVLRIAAPEPGRVLALAAQVAPDLDLRGRIEQAPLGRRAHHTGVAAVARRAPFDPAERPPGRIVLLEDPRHLGNVGAAVRVAAAAGAAAVLTTGAADPWDPPRSGARPGSTTRCPWGARSRPPTARSSRSTRTGRRPRRCRPRRRSPSGRSGTG